MKSTGISDIGKSIIRVGDDEKPAPTETKTAELVIESGVTVEASACYGVTAFGSTTKEIVTIKGTVKSTTDDNSNHDGAAVATNGTDITTSAVINIEDNAKIEATNENAIYLPSGTLTIGKAEITGNGGIEVKGGNVTINGATVKATASSSQHVAYGNGFSTHGYAIAVVENNAYKGRGPVLNITSGKFAGPVAVENDNAEGNTNQLAKVTVSGGVFSSAVDERYLAANTVLVPSGDDTSWTVIEQANTIGEQVKVTTEKTVAKAEESVSISQEVVTAVAGTTTKGLGGAVNYTVSEGSLKSAKAELLTEGTEESNTVYLHVQPYLDIVVTGETKNATENTKIDEIKLEIVPMVKTIVSTEENADKIVTEGNGKNAVVITEGEKATVANGSNIVITIPLPSGFVNNTNDIYIKHTKSSGISYVYTAKVSESGASYSATFTNPHGFSEFVLTKENPTEAEKGGVAYATLQSAVDAAGNGDEITIKKAGTYNVTISGNTNKTITFKSDADAAITVNTNVGTVTLGSKGTAGSVTYTAPVTPTTPIVIPSYTPSYSGSSSSSGNTYSWYFNPTPTPTPAPVLVAPAVALPKTGDMTIWQSILSFLGLL